VHEFRDFVHAVVKLRGIELNEKKFNGGVAKPQRICARSDCPVEPKPPHICAVCRKERRSMAAMSRALRV